ncbi:MAG: hypothetical protein L3J34_06395 [Flavobacteriaceae bacterium]|nr:hypothetical protein [Flavobacteriaceae bacterium]
MKTKLTLVLFFIHIIFFSSNYAQSQDQATAKELAIKLANPISNLISVPFQNNYDFNVGPLNGLRYTLNIQPVIPISISEDWNLISRTIVPITYQKDVSVLDETDFGLGDIVQSLFFSPKSPTNNGLIWGIGPIFLLPTATNDVLGTKKWATGLNAVFLKLQGQLTYGALINHMWSFAGNGLNDLNASFFQPFFTYATPKGSSYTIASENTRNWNNDLFGGFIGMYYAKVVKIKKQTLQVGGGPKIYYGNNFMNPAWGFRINIISLFPK